MVDERSLPPTGPSSYTSMVDYVGKVLEDNWVPSKDNTRMNPYEASSHALLKSILHRMDVSDGVTLDRETFQGVINSFNSQLKIVESTIKDKTTQQTMYHLILSNAVALGVADFSWVRIGCNHSLSEVMEGLDLLKPEHLKRSLDDLETRIGAVEVSNENVWDLAYMGKEYVTILRAHRTLLLKEETTSDEDD